MEVKRNFGRTLLLAAIFGAASITMADEASDFITTESSAAPAAVIVTITNFTADSTTPQQK